MPSVADQDREPVTGRRAGRPPRPPGDWLVMAWLALLVVPVFFFVAFGLAEVLYAAFGYDPGIDAVPWWVDVVCVLPAIALVLAPCAAAVVWGRRAAAAGARYGLVPAVVGGLVGAAFVVMSLVSL